MSYIRLNITDQNQTISDEVHGYLGNDVVALTAELETVEELGLMWLSNTLFEKAGW
jgi:hypothetical protein